jgi:hypothetical protein
MLCITFLCNRKVTANQVHKIVTPALSPPMESSGEEPGEFWQVMKQEPVCEKSLSQNEWCGTVCLFEPFLLKR